MSMEESISLAETNAIREKLGLKLLTDDGAPADTKDQAAEENYKKQRQREAKERETKILQERIAKIKNKRELNSALKGRTLGDGKGEDDTLLWVKRSKKQEKELKRRRLQEQEELEKQVQQEYSERDLTGLKVSHDFEELEEGEDRILTLKDSRILDNEEDELQNVEMAEHERTQKNNDLKIKKADYTGYDDEEFKEGHVGLKRAVLAKYDEDMNGETGFRLGSGAKKSSEAARADQEQAGASLNKSLLSIDYEKTFSTDDYLKEGDVGFKKPKKKRKHQVRKVTAEDIGIQPEDSMDVDIKPIARERNLDANFVDDDELQAALARSRRAKLNKAKKLKPEELAKKIAEERALEEAEAQRLIQAEEMEAVNGDEGGLTFDDTTEFVRAVGLNPVLERKPKVEPREVPIKPSRDVSMAPPASEVEDVPMTEVDTSAAVKEEPEEDEMAMLDDIEAAWKQDEVKTENAAAADEVGTQSEQTFKSMASTLGILRQTGLIATPNADQQERERTQLQQNLWLADQRRRVTQREMDRLASRGQPKDQAQREYENRLREQQEAREQLETFKHYKPDVNIVYYDEFGRALTPKEAWKALSHRFHGKGSGKAKTEKRLRKIAEERKQEAMVSGDTPTSMGRAFQARQEKAGQAHFVLSVGNRGAVPQAEGAFLDTQPLGKKQGQEKDKGKKKKEGKQQQQIAAATGGFMTLPAPQASPGPRAGFSRIGTMAEADRSGSGTPVGDRSKVHFGLKRKAEGEHEATPPPKARQ
ncbi:SART-1 protein [Schizophyllum amplum]|uniref:SART-1 protein n=1 Tax=Schizophyllum amplum TaxID=97359 RepID=A0A550CIQ8_9AGAR|nr:SART-1 protein [Auriculariopsis ampla]